MSHAKRCPPSAAGPSAWHCHHCRTPGRDEPLSLSAGSVLSTSVWGLLQLQQALELHALGS